MHLRLAWNVNFNHNNTEKMDVNTRVLPEDPSLEPVIHASIMLVGYSNGLPYLAVSSAVDSFDSNSTRSVVAYGRHAKSRRKCQCRCQIRLNQNSEELARASQDMEPDTSAMLFQHSVILNPTLIPHYNLACRSFSCDTMAFRIVYVRAGVKR